MPEPFDVPARGPDVYRSFVVPLDLDSDVWVRAVDFRPSARSVLHHSLFFLDDTGAARERDEDDPVPGSPAAWAARGLGGAARGGLAGRRGAARAAPGPLEKLTRRRGSLGGWALGGRAIELPDGLAFFVPEGRRPDPVHALPSVGQGRARAVDRRALLRAGPPTQAFTASSCRRFRRARRARHPAGRGALHDRRLVRPADRRQGVRRRRPRSLPRQADVVDRHLPDGSDQTLLSIPDWDFGWQEHYSFEDFVTLPKGTRLTPRSATTTRRPTAATRAGRRCG